LRIGEVEHAELRGSKRHGRSAKEAAAVIIDLFGYLERIHW
jgi:hypothetical protein